MQLWNEKKKKKEENNNNNINYNLGKEDASLKWHLLTALKVKEG